MSRSESRDAQRRVYWPYCIERLESGRYVALNRRYKPLGTASPKFVPDYEPWSFDLALTQSQARQLSWEDSDDLSRIYLYNDATIPTRNKSNMEAYEGRLALLASLGGPSFTSITAVRAAPLIEREGGQKVRVSARSRPAAATKRNANTDFAGGDNA